MRRRLQWGTSADALLLTFIKLVTITVSFVVTRLLSQHLTKYDYGTYSTILLIVTTIYSVSILGMIDGVNYFYCSRQDQKDQEPYLSTIYAFQTIIGIAVGALVMILTGPICVYFENDQLRRLMIFAASLPILHNLLSMTQVLLVSIGKARMIAIRNLIVSLVRLAAVIVVVSLVQDVAIILTTTLLLDLGQVVLFLLILRKNNCNIRLKYVDFRLLKTILSYCAPMGIYILIYSLNRDCDKYLIGLLTDTQTLAMYSNASKVLPFDIISASYVTVLLPFVTRYIAAKKKQEATQLYRYFLEITYITNTILCCAVLASAPQIMRLLYSEKYLDGIVIFCVYILVDLLKFTNITLLLSAAGKTKKLMYFSIAALLGNAALNVVLFYTMGIVGPAVATVMTSLILGICLMKAGAKELQCKLSALFDVKFLVSFLAGNAVLTVLFTFAQMWLAKLRLSYVLIIAIIFGAYAVTMFLLHGKRLLRVMKQVNTATKQKNI